MVRALPFTELTWHLKAELLRAFELEPIELEPRFEHALGAFRGHSALLSAWAFTGGPFRYARFVTLVGEGIELCNMLCLPHAHSRLPIFGAELVALGGGTVVAAADLSPVKGGVEPPRLPPAALPPGGALPAWPTRWFSRSALVTRTTRSDALPVARAVARYGDTFIALARTAAESDDDFTPQHLAYCRDWRHEDRPAWMLSRVFGDAWGAEFISTVMFPDALA